MKTLLLPIAIILGFQLSNIAPIGLPSGSLMFQLSGTCPARTTEATALSGLMFTATTIANGNAGTTGGSDTITPAGTNSTPTFTGNSVASSAVSGGTPAGTNGTSTVTPLGTIAWPAGVPTHSGTAIADHASHTHTYTDVVNHVHVETINSSLTGATGSGFPALLDASTSGGPTSLWMSTANPTGGVASGTTAGPNATLTHTVSNQGTVAWPAGVPSLSGSSSTVGAQTFMGSALGTHTHTTTATGSVSAPTFTGTQFDNRSAFVRVIVCAVN